MGAAAGAMTLGASEAASVFTGAGFLGLLLEALESAGAGTAGSSGAS